MILLDSTSILLYRRTQVGGLFVKKAFQRSEIWGLKIPRFFCPLANTLQLSTLQALQFAKTTKNSYPPWRTGGTL